MAYLAMQIVPLTPDRFDDFVRLIHALAAYEHLDPPDAAATERLKALGFQYVTLDLQGFRSGSMNEVLSAQTLKGVSS